MEEKDNQKRPKRITKAYLETIKRGKNLRPYGKATTAIINNIHESTINSIENQYSTAKYSFGLINKLSRGNNQSIADYRPFKPFRSNKLYQKFLITSVESFGGTKAFRALILNGYLDEPRTLEDIKTYATTLFCREYKLSNFGNEKLKLIEAGILLQGDGKEFPENTFILAEGAIIDWEL